MGGVMSRQTSQRHGEAYAALSAPCIMIQPQASPVSACPAAHHHTSVTPRNAKLRLVVVVDLAGRQPILARSTRRLRTMDLPPMGRGKVGVVNPIKRPPFWW